MGKQWQVIEESCAVKHVIPLEDDGYHIDLSIEEELPFGLAPTSNCLCRPKRIWEGNVCIFIHNSFDGREGLEWANELLKTIQ